MKRNHVEGNIKCLTCNQGWNSVKEYLKDGGVVDGKYPHKNHVVRTRNRGVRGTWIT